MSEGIAKASPATGAIDVIRLTLGYIYLHFGVLKFFPDLSPAEVIASYTAMKLTGFELDASAALVWVAVLECLIAAGFLFRVALRLTAILFFFHMAGTLLPLFVLPEFTFKIFPFAPTTEGQYILKNLVLIPAGWAVVGPEFRAAGSTVAPKAEASAPACPTIS